MNKAEAFQVMLESNPTSYIKNYKGSGLFSVYLPSNYKNTTMDICLGSFDNLIDAIDLRSEFFKCWFGFDIDYSLNSENDTIIPARRIGSILINDNMDVFTRTGKRPSEIRRGSFYGFETRLLGFNKIRISFSWVKDLYDGNGILYYCNRTGEKYLTPVDNNFILTKEPIDGFKYINFIKRKKND